MLFSLPRMFPKSLPCPSHPQPHPVPAPQQSHTPELPRELPKTAPAPAPSRKDRIEAWGSEILPKLTLPDLANSLERSSRTLTRGWWLGNSLQVKHELPLPPGVPSWESTQEDENICARKHV